MKGIIFDIQPYAIYDGPGIRTAVYFKGCPLRCWWCHNPEGQLSSPEMAWWKERCQLCLACIEVCPSSALELKNGAISRKRNLCTVCARCAEACPNQAMEKVGFEIETEKLVEIVLRDKAFYDNSSGGVTITGGEPTFQKDFLLDFLDALKSADIHRAIETCGHFPSELAEQLLKLVDLFLFDLKHIDPEKHKLGTGVKNDLILENFARILKEAPERIIPRIALIPSFNTDSSSISQFISFLKEAGYSGEVHLLPYHSWAKGKYQRLGREFREIGEISQAELEEISRAFLEQGFNPILYGG